ncbi:MAG: FxLYD domain-containing protein [Nitrososphaeraceae archaeon]
MSEPVQTVSPTQQPSGNISLGSLLSFSEYNNSRYGFKVQYPSNWQVVSITNSSVLPSITNNTTEIIARFKSPFDPQERIEDVLTISVENLSATSSQRGIRNPSVYDYAAPLIQQLSPMSKAPNEPNQAILILNESLDIMSDTGGKDNKNFSAWRIDYLSSDYKSDVFAISDNNLFDINFSTSKERATQSVPIFDKLLDTIHFINEKNNTTSGDTFGNTHTINATTNQSIPNLRTIPSSQILQQGVQPLSDLLQLDQDQNPQQQALLIPPFNTNPSDSQLQQFDQLLQQQPQQQSPFGEIQPQYQQQPGELFQQLPSALPQQTYPILPPSAPFSQLPSISPTYNYLSPVIMSQYPYANNLSSLQIVGEVLNQAPVVAKSVRIMATLYNQYGQVIGTDFTYTDPSDLSPGQWAPFNIIVQEDSAPMYQMTNYALSIDWRS